MSIEEVYKERQERFAKGEKISKLRKAVRMGKENRLESNLDSRSEYGMNTLLVGSDESRKKGEYAHALINLERANDNLHQTNFEGDKINKYAGAIYRRAKRIFDKVGDDKALTDRSYELLKELEGKYKPMTTDTGLESAVTAIIGIGAGLFFLSGNITGNVVGNLSGYGSNLIGAILMFVGVIGAFFWVKGRR